MAGKLLDEEPAFGVGVGVGVAGGGGAGVDVGVGVETFGGLGVGVAVGLLMFVVRTGAGVGVLLVCGPLVGMAVGLLLSVTAGVVVDGAGVVLAVIWAVVVPATTWLVVMAGCWLVSTGWPVPPGFVVWSSVPVGLVERLPVTVGSIAPLDSKDPSGRLSSGRWTWQEAIRKGKSQTSSKTSK